MNIPYAVATVVVIGLMLYLAILAGRQVPVIRTSTKVPDGGRVWLTRLVRLTQGGLCILAAVLVLVIANAYVVRIPNPFELPPASLGDLPASKNRPVPVGPLATPPTNADPAAAAERARRLLDEAREQQQKDLKK